ncbi:MAG: lysine exporter LysO family protein [Candidatus Dactylopiibacterium sp.]|nr:lysine exporter LysO family protein [Candidatus Dactylopiibacterium sp.]
MPLIQSILPIVLALAAGYLAGRRMPAPLKARLIRLIAPLVWLLLFLIGAEFGEVISSARSVGHVLRTAGIFAALTTLLPCALICFTRRRAAPQATPRGGFRLEQVWPPLKECGIALLMVLLGCAFFLLNHALLAGALRLPSSPAFLLLLIVLVGVDLTQVRLGAHWFSAATLSVPGLVVAGSLLAAVAASWLTGESLKVALALSSGFGWFTLSSVLVGAQLGQTYGTMALMTDLLRELLAVVILYTLGRRHPHAGIGSAGATALDSTLPIVKQACAPEAVPLALVSGFVLTVLAPVFITFFLS